MDSPIISLNTINSEINMAINTYESWFEMYNNSVVNGNYADNKRYIENIKLVADRIITLAEIGIQIIDDAVANNKPYTGDNVITRNELLNIKTLYSDKKTNIKPLNKDDLEGKYDVSKKIYENDYLKFIFIVIIGVIIAGLTANSMISRDDIYLEISIIVIIVGLITYFFIANLNI